jgi:hypothetical protein
MSARRRRLFIAQRAPVGLIAPVPKNINPLAMALAQESSTENTPETLVPKLPTREGWTEPLFLYNKYWLRRCLLERVMLLRANFKARRHEPQVRHHLVESPSVCNHQSFTVRL